MKSNPGAAYYSMNSKTIATFLLHEQTVHDLHRAILLYIDKFGASDARLFSTAGSVKLVGIMPPTNRAEPPDGLTWDDTRRYWVANSRKVTTEFRLMSCSSLKLLGMPNVLHVPPEHRHHPSEHTIERRVLYAHGVLWCLWGYNTDFLDDEGMCRSNRISEDWLRASLEQYHAAVGDQ